MTSRVAATALMLLFTVVTALPVYRVFAQEELKDPEPLAVKLPDTVKPANKESMARFTVELTVDENSAPDGLSPPNTPSAPELEPTSLEFPNITFTLPEAAPQSQPDVFLGEAVPAPPPPPGGLLLPRLGWELGIGPSEPRDTGDLYRPVIPGSIPNAEALGIIDEEMLGGESLSLGGSGEALLPALAQPSAAMAAGSQQSAQKFNGVIESLTTKYTMGGGRGASRSLQSAPSIQGIQGQKVQKVAPAARTLQ